ncbi:MAG TPA: FAD-dependent oxidoreductase, partial [Verrucomicrobiota bacterium]|nr:FAD-dependent oxidoreductase [Verrucomicrobiota bacterium]
MEPQKKLLIVGNGMAAARVVEEIIKRAKEQFYITMFGAEPYGNYNRILLSNVLNGTQSATDIFMNPLAWYEENNIKLHAGVKVTQIDREKRIAVGTPLTPNAIAYATDSKMAKMPAVEEPYDQVIIATGSRPFVPPMDGFEGAGTFLFRTIDDCARIANYAKARKRAAVIGGGLLGLEAARGLLTHGVEVTVIEACPQLMAMQLDAESGNLLRASIEDMGIKVLTDVLTTNIVRDHNGITGLDFNDGSSLDTDMVVVSCGIRPITEVAVASDLKVSRGITVDDQMRTSDPDIFALGECVEHREVIYGLVDPIWKQASVLADVITGTAPDSAYEGSKLTAKLKVMGVDLASMGDKEPASPEDEVVVYREPRSGIYKKLIIRDDKIAGAILLGDTDRAETLIQIFMSDQKAPDRRADLLFPANDGQSLIQVLEMPDNIQICNCIGVSKGQIVEAIQNGNSSMVKVCSVTKAGTGCQSCKGVIAQLVEAYRDAEAEDFEEHYYVPGVPLEKSELVMKIQAKGIKSVSEVFKQLAGGVEHAASKVGLASLLKTLWADEYIDERDARFINDRVHANIQNDGTFSVIPRIYGGVTSPDELMRIAKTSIKYNVPMV